MTVLPSLGSLWLPVFDDVSHHTLTRTPSDNTQSRRSSHFFPQGFTHDGAGGAHGGGGRAADARGDPGTRDCGVDDGPGRAVAVAVAVVVSVVTTPSR